MTLQNKFNNLTCPIEELPLEFINSSLKCSQNHCFDIAKKSYVNLLPVQFKKSKNPGDSKEMVAARSEFLNSGIYQPIAELLVDILKENTNNNSQSFIIDAGCGEGYYLDFAESRLQNLNLSFLGLDISKDAVIAASKRNKTISWIVASNKNLPIARNSVDIVLCQFGFPFYDQFSKILKKNGKIILVDTALNHLIELRNIIYSEVKTSDLPDIKKAHINGFKLLTTKNLTYKKILSSCKQINNLLSMTPHLFRATAEGKKKVAELNEIELTIDISFRILGREILH